MVELVEYVPDDSMDQSIRLAPSRATLPQSPNNQARNDQVGSERCGQLNLGY